MITPAEPRDTNPEQEPFLGMNLSSGHRDPKVKLDRIMVQEAFSESAYQKRLRHQYDLIGTVKTRHNSDGDLENVFKEYKKKVLRDAFTKSKLARGTSHHS